MGWFCKIFGHRWNWYMYSGDNGEPSEDKCRRCGLQVVYIGQCRCLTHYAGEPQCSCIEGLLNAVWKGRVPKSPVVHPKAPLYVFHKQIGTWVTFIQRGRESTLDEDIAPVVQDLTGALPRVEPSKIPGEPSLVFKETDGV